MKRLLIEYEFSFRARENCNRGARIVNETRDNVRYETWILINSLYQ